MLNKIKNRKEEGFTIIEVLIVLAIAGLILLIVFLAVPALQRNSRNTQARNEASNILGAVSEFVTNNNGKLPTASTSTCGTTPPCDAAKIASNAKLTTVTTIVVEAATGTTAPSGTQAVIRLGAKCTAASGPSGNMLTPAGATRAVALLYEGEDSSGKLTFCQES